MLKQCFNINYIESSILFHTIMPQLAMGQAHTTILNCTYYMNQIHHCIAFPHRTDLSSPHIVYYHIEIHPHCIQDNLALLNRPSTHSLHHTSTQYVHTLRCHFYRGNDFGHMLEELYKKKKLMSFNLLLFP